MVFALLVTVYEVKESSRYGKCESICGSPLCIVAKQYQIDLYSFYWEIIGWELNATFTFDLDDLEKNTEGQNIQTTIYQSNKKISTSKLLGAGEWNNRDNRTQNVELFETKMAADR